MRELIPVTAREFDVVSLRRQAPADTSSNGWRLALGLGQRLARLAAEAPLGTRVTVTTRANDALLAITIRVDAGTEVELGRSGLSDADSVVDHMAHECADLLDDFAVVSAIRHVRGAEANDGPALRILPRGRTSGLRPVGFRGNTAPQDGSWALPQASSSDELARLLLLNPHVRLVQSVSPVDDVDVEAARDDMADDVPFDAANAIGAIGTPVRVHAALVAEDAPWILPVRLREHLRGWFDLLDIDETPTQGSLLGVVVPEFIAAGMLRLPATVSEVFPGLPVVPPTVPLDSALSAGTGIRVGYGIDRRKRPLDVVVDDEAMSRHVHVVGESGSGKSTLLAAIAVETARSGGGLLMLDPHGTTVDRVLRELPPEARARTWVIRCGDVKNPIRLNPFAIEDPELRDVVVSDVLAVMQQLFDPKQQGFAGPRFIHSVKNILDTLIALRGTRTSLLDVPRMVYSTDMQKAAVAALSDPDLVQFWKNDFLGNRSNDSNELVAWIASKFTNIATNKAVSQVLATGADSFDPATAMADNRIVLIDLDKGAVGQLGAKMLGLLYLTRFWVAALSREVPTPFTVLVDEASTFSAVSLPAILSEGRKFGLRAVVAHQFMGQLEEGLADAIQGSVATRIVFRVGAEDAHDLALATSPGFLPTDLTALPQFTAAMRLADSGRAVRPFTLTVDHNERAGSGDASAEAVAEIEARSIRELVDPHRDAQAMTLADLEALTPTPEAPESSSQEAFLEAWLAKRKGRSSAQSPEEPDSEHAEPPSTDT